jgi:hypothetical protein
MGNYFVFSLSHFLKYGHVIFLNSKDLILECKAYFHFDRVPSQPYSYGLSSVSPTTQIPLSMEPSSTTLNIATSLPAPNLVPHCQPLLLYIPQRSNGLWRNCDVAWIGNPPMH